MKLLFLGALAPISGALLLAGCSTASGDHTRSAEAQQELEKALAGRVAGQPLSCIPSYRTMDMQIIDDWTILFDDRHTIYLQTPRGGCPGIDSHRHVLVTKMRGGAQLCNGDINELIDIPTGTGGGACVFGPFVPYTKPKG